MTEPAYARPDGSHPEGPGQWTLLQDHVDHQMWQQNETDGTGQAISRFWVVNPPETLTFDTFDEAEAMFESIGDGEPDVWASDEG